MKVDYSKMEAYYQAIEATLSNLLKDMSEIRSVVKKMNNRDHWDGKGYDAYNKKSSGLANNYNATCGKIESVNAKISAAVDTYKQTDAAVINNAKG